MKDKIKEEMAVRMETTDENIFKLVRDNNESFHKLLNIKDSIQIYNYVWIYIDGSGNYTGWDRGSINPSMYKYNIVNFEDLFDEDKNMKDKILKILSKYTVKPETDAE